MITSIVGPRGFSELSNYATSKGALEAFSKSVAIEYAKKNVRINCVAPGFIKTSYFEKFPRILYSQNNGRELNVVPDILRRVKIQEILNTQNVAFDLYDVQNGDTPEILADRVYNDP
jgi:NAD(P)-dependent dehydrogenase (short-subunit alcohol dehydrogenase family)